MDVLEVEKKVYRLADRFKEPSSLAGIAGIVAILGLKLPPDILQSVAYAVAGTAGIVAGILAVFIPEGAKK